MTNNYRQHVDKVQKEINEVSSSFCIAKWKQVTIHLQNGHTHSCHHPNTHIIPIHEITRNPTALHNTEYKKQQRKLMLEGIRPKECDYCWRVEDTGQISDRAFKSADSWAYPHLKNIANSQWHNDIDPSYVEVSFSNVCNFKCSYCAPHISSPWMEEIEKFGPYPTSRQYNNILWLERENKLPIPNKDDNPYVDAFWQWWPKMYRELQTFRITGGEPLLSKNTFKVLDYIIENPNDNLNLCINSNLCVPDELIDRMIEKLKHIQIAKKIKTFTLYTSAEAHGKQSDYIRYGMDYQKWYSNLEKVIREIPSITVSIMSTYNLMSLFSYKKFLKDIVDLKFKYHYLYFTYNRMPLMIDIPYLRDPQHQAVYIMPPHMLHNIKEQIDFMNENKSSEKNNYSGFKDIEIYKLERIKSVIEDYISNSHTNLNVLRKDFINFVDEHDKRRGTNFLETFPEFKETYEQWKKL